MKDDLYDQEADCDDGLEAKDTEDWQELPETQAFKQT